MCDLGKLPVAIQSMIPPMIPPDQMQSIAGTLGGAGMAKVGAGQMKAADQDSAIISGGPVTDQGSIATALGNAGGVKQVSQQMPKFGGQRGQSNQI